MPEDISVIGYDDDEDSVFFNPPLTTIHRNFVELGKQATIKVIDAIKNGTTSIIPLVIDTKLLIRDSTSMYKKKIISKNDIIMKLSNLQKDIENL